MTLVVLYVSTAVVFLSLDLFGIKYLIMPVFAAQVGHLLADPIRLWPACVFYLAYVLGVVWFVSVDALGHEAPHEALTGGIALGLLCYATYEVTNYATLADWSLRQVVVDCAWGAALTGISAWAGVSTALYFG